MTDREELSVIQESTDSGLLGGTQLGD